MAESPRRNEERVPCDLAASLASLTSGAPIGEVRLRDLGLGGAALECGFALQRGVSYELRVSRCRLPARVAWEGKPAPKTKTLRYGLTFTLTRAQEEALQPLLDELRRGPWSAERPLP